MCNFIYSGYVRGPQQLPTMSLYPPLCCGGTVEKQQPDIKLRRAEASGVISLDLKYTWVLQTEKIHAFFTSGHGRHVKIK